jgi:hypothetical protein
MTMQRVVDWALSRGFARGGDGALRAPWREGVAVRIEPLARTVRVSLEGADGSAARIGTFNPRRAFVNEQGMLEGIGLSASFASRCRSPDELPSWWPEAYAASWRKILKGGPVVTLKSQPAPPPRDGGRPMTRPDVRPGTRVRLLENEDRYPHGICQAGSTGVISEVADGNVFIKMDARYAWLDEWGNELEMTYEDDKTSAVDVTMRNCEAIGPDVPAFPRSPVLDDEDDGPSP